MDRYRTTLVEDAGNGLSAFDYTTAEGPHRIIIPTRVDKLDEWPVTASAWCGSHKLDDLSPMLTSIMFHPDFEVNALYGTGLMFFKMAHTLADRLSVLHITSPTLDQLRDDSTSPQNSGSQVNALLEVRRRIQCDRVAKMRLLTPKFEPVDCDSVEYVVQRMLVLGRRRTLFEHLAIFYKGGREVGYHYPVYDEHNVDLESTYFAHKSPRPAWASREHLAVWNTSRASAMYNECNHGNTHIAMPEDWEYDGGPNMSRVVSWLRTFEEDPPRAARIPHCRALLQLADRERSVA